MDENLDPTVSESIQLIDQPDLDGSEGELIAAAFKLMENCDSDPNVKVAHGLRLLSTSTSPGSGAWSRVFYSPGPIYI